MAPTRTWSPISYPMTPIPSSSMTPTGSWPISPGRTGYSPFTMWTSVLQMVVVVSADGRPRLGRHADEGPARHGCRPDGGHRRLHDVGRDDGGAGRFGKERHGWPPDACGESPSPAWARLVSRDFRSRSTLTCRVVSHRAIGHLECPRRHAVAPESLSEPGSSPSRCRRSDRGGAPQTPQPPTSRGRPFGPTRTGPVTGVSCPKAHGPPRSHPRR